MSYVVVDAAGTHVVMTMMMITKMIVVIRRVAEAVVVAQYHVL